MDDQPLENLQREPRKPQEAADVAVGEALVGGQIAERGDVAALAQVDDEARLAHCDARDQQLEHVAFNMIHILRQ